MLLLSGVNLCKVSEVDNFNPSFVTSISTYTMFKIEYKIILDS